MRNLKHDEFLNLAKFLHDDLVFHNATSSSLKIKVTCLKCKTDFEILKASILNGFECSVCRNKTQ